MDRDLSKDEFQRFHDFIYEIAGIHYPADKLSLLSNRIRQRLRATGEKSFDAYLRRISSQRRSPEMQEFLDSVTTNETYFFRCMRHWDYFRGWLEEQKRAGSLQQGIRLWSAAASNGAEACTMLIVLHQVFGDNFGGMPVEILGTDINQTILEEARRATFRAYALAQTPPDVVKRYFKKSGVKDEYVFDRTLLRNARFDRHNLMERMPTSQPFDAVFVRNVMIYFDQQSREKVLAQTHDVIRPGGLLIVGESESLLSVKHPFRYLKPSIFMREGAPVAKA